jgi:hypothetical protein
MLADAALQRQCSQLWCFANLQQLAAFTLTHGSGNAQADAASKGGAAPFIDGKSMLGCHTLHGLQIGVCVFTTIWQI